jgi:hypothetical protein
MGSKEALPAKLSDALVSAVGTDLGVISAEVAKASAFARYKGVGIVDAAILKGTLHRPGGMDLLPISKALASSSDVAMLRALIRLKERVPDPVMLLLRARGGPGYLSVMWLRIATLLEAGASSAELVDRLSLPEWALKREIPAARRWGVERLRGLVSALADVEDGVLRGVPSPWVSCVAALVRSCRR